MGRGRKKLGFGFANAFFDAVKDHVRSRSPIVEREGEWGMSMFMTPSRESSRAASRSAAARDNTPLRGRPRDKGKFKESEWTVREGDECVDEEKEASGRWKEFRKGAFECSYFSLGLLSSYSEDPRNVTMCMYVQNNLTLICIHRCLYVPHLISHSRQLATFTAVRQCECHLGAQRLRSSARSVHR